MDKKVIAVFGGSFNPPLNSHFSLAEEIINEMPEIEKVLFIPVNTKYGKNGLISNEDRYNLLKCVCDNNEKFDVSNIELIQERQLNTYETLEILKDIYPEYELYFITGTDNMAELYTWGYVDLLLSKYKLIIIERNSDEIEKIIESQEFLQKYKNSFIRYNQKIRTNMSSTFVREQLKNGKDVKYLMPKEVYDYIKEKELYKN